MSGKVVVNRPAKGVVGWIKWLISFFKRTIEQLLMEYRLETREWGKGPHIHKLDATYEFGIEQQPISGYYFPTVTITEKHWEVRKEWVRPISVIFGPDMLMPHAHGWEEEVGRWVYDTKQRYIYIDKNHKGFLRVDESHSRDIPFPSYDDALNAIALYKERFLRFGVITHHVEAVKVTEDNGQRIVVT